MRSKFKNNILIWGTVMLGGVFVLGTIIPITLNFVGKDKVSAKFNQSISFADNTKYGKYYDVGTKSFSSSTSINQDDLNNFWMHNVDNREMQLAEIIYGINKFIPSITSLYSYSYQCTIYNYEHRITKIDNQTKWFQFKFWYAIQVDYHPKKPDSINYTSGYRFYVDWTRPELFPSEQSGLYNILYEKYYTYTPIMDDWELRYANTEIPTHSLVFANQEFK